PDTDALPWTSADRRRRSQDIVDDRADLVEPEGFRDHGDAGLPEEVGRRGVGEPRYENEAGQQLRPPAGDLAIEARPIQLRHDQIADDDAVLALPQPVERRASIRNDLHGPAVELEQVAEEGRDLGFVLNEQQVTVRQRQGLPRIAMGST